MATSRCAAKCSCGLSRRDFLRAGACLAGAAMIGGCEGAAQAPIAAGGPGAKLTPVVKAAFVRRKGAYGLRWPGAVYDGEAARKMYTEKVLAEAKAINLKADIRLDPIHSAAEADAWIADAKAAGADGLLLVLLDRQEHAWPTAAKAIDSGLRTVVFAPVGTAFTTNTLPLAKKVGGIIYSTDDFRQPAYGMRMLATAARLKAARVVVIRGNERKDTVYKQLGINLRFVPAGTFTDLYKATAESDEMRAIADEHLRGATRVIGAARQDVINGARSYVVARTILAQEQADGISMDCLGALGPTKIALPCLAWSRLNDEGVPAGCEADIGAVGSHVLVQYLFGRPGFQVDPVGETARQAVIGSHCSCPTRLAGFDQPPEPYLVRHHHGERDATIQTLWRAGQEVTSLDVETSATKPGTYRLLIQEGKVLENVSVPPSGGCVVAPMIKFDGAGDVLANPGFHQVYFYGNYRQHLLDFARLMDIEAVVA
jgi:hypothetical protein